MFLDFNSFYNVFLDNPVGWNQVACVIIIPGQ